ncbi:uncharacterized protein LOC127098334 [Lathyrus oleraceus]|uniref:uncharacterized protein LOC127098334 n=1 Tax=Pisum sativum TaxID=3888 RepID=UPI0021CE844F|nr:uncharacterized protein LOC127098334 [Pisum sativum]
MIDAFFNFADDIPPPPPSMNASNTIIQTDNVYEAPRKVPEEVPLVDNEESDGSVHSHIFSTSKVPPITPPTLIRRRKAQAKKTSSKATTSIMNPTVPDDLEEVFAPHDPDRTPPISPPHVAPQPVAVDEAVDDTVEKIVADCVAADDIADVADVDNYPRKQNMIDAFFNFADDIPPPPPSMNASNTIIQTDNVYEAPRKVPEEVPLVDNEESDGSVHSHIFSTSKVPPITPPTLIRRRKAQAKKTSSKATTSIMNPTVPDDLEEVFAPHDPDRTPPISPPHVAPQEHMADSTPTEPVAEERGDNQTVEVVLSPQKQIEFQSVSPEIQQNPISQPPQDLQMLLTKGVLPTF